MPHASNPSARACALIAGAASDAGIVMAEV
jgi:hypothetical protein